MFVGAAQAAVPNPTIIGPIPSGAAPGDPSHNYPFFATNLFKAGSGYVEQEFFVEGAATRYSTSCSSLIVSTILFARTGYGRKHGPSVQDSDGGTPAERPAKFNGVVVVEWFNVTAQFELDVQWYRSSEYCTRKGFAYVGVGPQRVGIHVTPNGLRAWNPNRYGSLDVTVGGTVMDDSLKWSIFSQVGQALAHPVGVDPLGGLGATEAHRDR